jgi:hypothetical protein
MGSRSLLGLCLALLAAFAAPNALHAQEAPSAAAADAHEDLYGALLAAADNDAAIDNQIETLKQALAAQDPNIAAIEASRPGLLAVFGDSLRPWMVAHSQRIAERFRPRFVTMLREELTADDARRLARFYRSPTGLKLMRSASRGFTGANVLGDIDDLEKPATENDVQRDVTAAAWKGVLDLTAEDMRVPEAEIFNDPALVAKMGAVSGRVITLRTEMENTPPDADIEQGLTASLEQSLDAYLAEMLDEPAG